MCSRSTGDRIPDDKFDFNYKISRLKIILENVWYAGGRTINKGIVYESR